MQNSIKKLACSRNSHGRPIAPVLIQFISLLVYTASFITPKRKWRTAQCGIKPTKRDTAIVANNKLTLTSALTFSVSVDR